MLRIFFICQISFFLNNTIFDKLILLIEVIKKFFFHRTNIYVFLSMEKMRENNFGKLHHSWNVNIEQLVCTVSNCEIPHNDWQYCVPCEYSILHMMALLIYILKLLVKNINICICIFEKAAKLLLRKFH